MEGSGQDHPVGEFSGDTRTDRPSDQYSSSAAAGGGGYQLFDRQHTIHQVVGGGKAADIMLWKCWGVSIVVIVVATVAWLVFERSGLPFLTISSDMLLILIILHFIWANSAGMLNTMKLKCSFTNNVSQEASNYIDSCSFYMKLKCSFTNNTLSLSFSLYL